MKIMKQHCHFRVGFGIQQLWNQSIWICYVKMCKKKNQTTSQILVETLQCLNAWKQFSKVCLLGYSFQQTEQWAHLRQWWASELCGHYTSRCHLQSPYYPWAPSQNDITHQAPTHDQPSRKYSLTPRLRSTAHNEQVTNSQPGSSPPLLFSSPPWDLSLPAKIPKSLSTCLESFHCSHFSYTANPNRNSTRAKVWLTKAQETLLTNQTSGQVRLRMVNKHRIVLTQCGASLGCQPNAVLQHSPTPNVSSGFTCVETRLSILSQHAS